MTYTLQSSKLIVFSVIAVFYLSLSAASYATTISEESLETDLSKYTGPSVIHVLQGLPRNLLYPRTIEIAFTYPLNLNRFLALVVNADCIEQGDESKTRELVTRRNELIRSLIIEKGADANHLLYMSITKLSMDRVSLNNLNSLPEEDSIYLANMAISLGARFSNIEEILYTTTFPSPETIEIMLKNPENSVSPASFLNFVVDLPCHNEDELERKKELITSALNRGADINEISFISFPEPEIAELLINKGLDPNHFIDLISKIFILKKDCYAEKIEKTCKIDEELVKQRDSLVNLAVQKGAEYRKIDDKGWLKVVDYYNLASNKNIVIKDNLDLKDDEGKTLLMLIGQQGCLKCTKFFLKMGANPYVEDDNGETVTTLAAKAGNSKVAQELQNHQNKEYYEETYDLHLQYEKSIHVQKTGKMK